MHSGKSKVMVFERARKQVTDSAKLYRVRAEGTMKSKIRLEEERTEEVGEF